MFACHGITHAATPSVLGVAPHPQPVLDMLHAGNVLRQHDQALALSLRCLARPSRSTVPSSHRGHDAERTRPRFPLHPRIEIHLDFMVTPRAVERFVLLGAHQRPHQIGTAQDADEPAAGKYRHALDAGLVEQAGDSLRARCSRPRPTRAASSHRWPSGRAT